MAKSRTMYCGAHATIFMMKIMMIVAMHVNATLETEFKHSDLNISSVGAG